MPRTRLPTFLIFKVIDPEGLTRHSQHLKRGTRFAIKRTSSKRHVERWLAAGRLKRIFPEAGTCGVCHCTEEDCSGCIKRTGEPCHWLDPEQTVCSACY